MKQKKTWINKRTALKERGKNKIKITIHRKIKNDKIIHRK